MQDQANEIVNMPDVSINRTQGAIFFLKEKEGDMKVERAMFGDVWGWGEWERGTGEDRIMTYCVNILNVLLEIK